MTEKSEMSVSFDYNTDDKSNYNNDKTDYNADEKNRLNKEEIKNKQNIWENALLGTQKKTKPTRTRKITSYKFPELLECMNYTDDEFWRQRLDNAAAGKYPTHFAYFNNVLKHKKKQINCQLSADPKERCYQFINFLRDEGNIYSPNDQIEKKEHLEEKSTKQKETWKSISLSKNRRATFIRNYISREYEKFSKTTQDNIFTHINNSLELGILKSSNIVFENDEISNITGIYLDENENIFYDIDISNFTKPIKSVTKKEKKEKLYSHYDNWCKYIKDFKKGINVQSSDVNFTDLETKDDVSECESESSDVSEVN